MGLSGDNKLPPLDKNKVAPAQEQPIVSKAMQRSNGVNHFTNGGTDMKFDGVVVTITDPKTKEPKDILSGISGSASAGEILGE